MNSKTMRRVVPNLILMLSLFIPVAQAQQPFDITDSFFAKLTMLSESKELTIMGSEVWGITTGNNENKAFDNLTSYCLAVRKFLAGKPHKSLTYTKFMDMDGDFFIVETARDGTEAGPEGTWTFLEGTGKWKGIKGGGKAWFSARGKTQTPGTLQGRVRMTGTFELPKGN
jgi:hypothetical protein